MLREFVVIVRIPEFSSFEKQFTVRLSDEDSRSLDDVLFDVREQYGNWADITFVFKPIEG